jgi:hypothetical protein
MHESTIKASPITVMNFQTPKQHKIKNKALLVYLILPWPCLYVLQHQSSPGWLGGSCAQYLENKISQR